MTVFDASNARSTTGREIGIESQRPAGFADHFAVLAEELAVAGGKDVGGGRASAEDVAEAVDAASFHVHSGEERGGDAGLAVLEQLVGLLSAGDVAGEEDDAGGLYSGQQGGEAGGHLGAVEADDQQLADAVVKIRGVGHCEQSSNPDFLGVLCGFLCGLCGKSF